MINIKIGDRQIGEKKPVYVIAEIGLNHQGDINLAKQLIDLAVEAKCDCVKFQKRSIKDLYKKDVIDNPDNQEQGLKYILDHVVKCELTDQQMIDLKEYSDSKGVQFLCTPWDDTSLKFLAELNLPAYKLGSPDMFNLSLMRQIVFLHKPLIISTGMSFVSEIDQVIDFLNSINAQYILLHCNSTYPASYHDINLKFLQSLQQKSNYPIGYSGHEKGISVSLAAVAMGAKVIERHITLDKNMSGPDHKASLEPHEFKEMVKQIRIVEESLGEPVRYPSRGEFLNRENLSKSLVATREIKKGTILDYDDITIKSPGHGTKPLKLDYFVGRKLTKRDLSIGDYLLESDIDLYSQPVFDKTKINHQWGVVVRMSDIDGLLLCGSDFVEVHLTDSDINNDQNYAKKYNLNLVVHGPEYNDDLLLDLSSLDNEIREKSIDFFNKAIEHARKLKKLFKNRNELVKFVVHPGGMNMAAPLLDKIPELNNNLQDSLSKLNAEGFELLIENMPGHPWYFGGQWYHSSFMDAEEIANFSKQTGYGIVFDTSHAALYCNYYKKDFEEFTKTILPVTKYVHISDAVNYNGEGLKIGDGTIDFKMLLEYLVKTDLWFLPEIWQGHKFGGEDFVGAIKSLKLINPKF